MSKQKYLTEEERKAAKKAIALKSYYKNRESRLKRQNDYYADNKDVSKKYYERNKEKIIDYQIKYQKEYDKTPMARASKLMTAYKTADKKSNRGECTITTKWIVDNIFSQPCHYCGESDWTKIGCDRIDNSKPHTPDNVVPCCGECNIKRGTKDYEEFIEETMMRG